MYDDERSSFQSNLFSFKTERANMVASYCLIAGLAIGFFMGLVGYFGFHLGMWFKIVPFGTALGGLAGTGFGYVLGKKIDAKRKKKEKGSAQGSARY